MTTLPAIRVIAAHHYSNSDVEDPTPYLDAIGTGTLLYVHVQSSSRQADGSWGIEANLLSYPDPVTSDTRFAVEFWNPSEGKTTTDYAARRDAIQDYDDICAKYDIDKRIRVPHQD